MTFTVPIKAPSTANLREHWAARAQRSKSQRDAARLNCPAWPGGPLLLVRLVRVAPRLLDTDNLATALKHIRDGIADRLKVDDATPLVRWEYEQEKASEAGVRVTIERVG